MLDLMELARKEELREREQKRGGDLKTYDVVPDNTISFGRMRKRIERERETSLEEIQGLMVAYNLKPVALVKNTSPNAKVKAYKVFNIQEVRECFGIR